jgi:hypothetical protein
MDSFASVLSVSAYLCSTDLCRWSSTWVSLDALILRNICILRSTKARNFAQWRASAVPHLTGRSLLTIVTQELDFSKKVSCLERAQIYCVFVLLAQVLVRVCEKAFDLYSLNQKLFRN